MNFNAFAKKEMQRRGMGASARRTFWRFISRDIDLDEPLAAELRALHRRMWSDYHRLHGDQSSHPE